MAWNKRFIKKIIHNESLTNLPTYKKIIIAGGLSVFLIIFTLYACRDDNTQPHLHTNATSTIVLNAQQNALEQFNQTVQITPLNYHLYKDKTGKEMIAFKYELTNKDTETLSQVKWYTVISQNKQLLGIFAVSTTLTLPPKGQMYIIYHIPLTHFPNNLQQNLMTDKSLKLNVTTIAGNVVLGDEKKITVTTDEMLKKELNGFFKQENTQ